MAEINATLSFHMDSRHNEKHDLRQIYVPYVDTERSKNNVYYNGKIAFGEGASSDICILVSEIDSEIPDRISPGANGCVHARTSFIEHLC